MVDLEPGRYIVAVSGGVDSVVLLHLLTRQPDIKLVVAHFDHGIRPDSQQDRLHVQKLANYYGLPFLYDEGHLGSGASEAAARAARYNFLHTSRAAAGADAILTAHHKDDVLETAIINILRGTGRKGLAALKTSYVIQRPLLHVTKAELQRYAKEQGLAWREDSTNYSPEYLRNHIRLRIIPRLSGQEINKIHTYIARAGELDPEIDRLVGEWLKQHTTDNKLSIRAFRQLPHALAREVLAGWLRANAIRDFDKKMLERLAHAAKIHRVGREVPVNKMTALRIYDDYLALEPAER